MKEPTTVKQAKQLTLRKIGECMELPYSKRSDFWFKKIWDSNVLSKRYCAFCVIAEHYDHEDKLNCVCNVKSICHWFEENISSGILWADEDLRKLYSMVEAIEC